MIRSLGITGFKRFKSEHLDLKPLTILAGLNGAGKTSVIQAILLARHASQRRDGIAKLNGPFGLELGWFDDVLNVDVEGSFDITLTNEEGEFCTWTFTKGDTELYAKVSQSNAKLSFFSNAPARGFQYLSAERNGPRLVQKSAPLPLEMLEVGSRGEHVAQIIEKLGSQMVPLVRHMSSSVDNDLALVKAQSEQWLSRIVKKVQIDTSAFPDTDTISISYRNERSSSPWVKSTNMGFGISYALPIIVAAMTASHQGLLIVENPEAHLHPAGQSEIGIFLSRMATAGLQVILETHSDHVINGIRRAIGVEQILAAHDAIVHFFADEVSHSQPLNFTASGGITEWPSGFFDQYRVDVQRITTARRPA